MIYKYLSGKRDSNPRPSAWEADALPTELLPHSAKVHFFFNYLNINYKIINLLIIYLYLIYSIQYDCILKKKSKISEINNLYFCQMLV